LQEYISDFPHHGIKEWMLLQRFYHGLNQKASEHQDAAAKGSFLSLTTRQANTLMQKISENQGWTQKNTQQCHQSEEVQEDEELKELSTSMDVLLNRLEERANFKKDRQALQDSMNTSRNSSLVVHKSAPTQEKVLQPQLTYAGKYTSNNSKRHSLRELIEEHDKITNNLFKKLVDNDKILEDINIKMDIFSEILKDQAIFNAKLESKLSKLSAAAPVAINHEQVFNVRTRGGKQTADPPYPKGTTRPRARISTTPATSAVPVAPAEAPEKDNDVEEVVQEEQDSTKQDFHDTNFIPYPRRVREPQVDDQFGKFIKVIQKLYVNIPLLDAMQVPTYAKYI
jgi:hypothetical protein